MIEIILMTCPEPQMRVKPSEQRSVLPLEVSQMPFAHNVRCIAQLLQILRQQFLGQWQASWLCGIQHGVLHSGVNGMFAGHQGRSGWCADCGDVESIKNQTGKGERIDVRRGQLRWAMEANVVPALSVKVDYFDIIPKKISIGRFYCVYLPCRQPDSIWYAAVWSGHLWRKLIVMQ